ncbi:hypothetical protein Tco_0284688 [Tanacetum coccineum]
MSRRVESSTDQERLGVPEDASKQGRNIEDIDADIDVSLVDETQERQDDDLMFDTGILDDKWYRVFPGRLSPTRLEWKIDTVEDLSLKEGIDLRD